MSKYQIDATDHKILAFLVKNARMLFLKSPVNAGCQELPYISV